jgi:hypothetical protein
VPDRPSETVQAGLCRRVSFPLPAADPGPLPALGSCCTPPTVGNAPYLAEGLSAESREDLVVQIETLRLLRPRASSPRWWRYRRAVRTRVTSPEATDRQARWLKR